MESNFYRNTKTRRIFFTEKEYVLYMKLLKILLRLDILDEESTINLAMEFMPFFV